jgi:hypothetical protein
LVLAAFLASFCLLCFWVFFGLLSPMRCSFHARRLTRTPVVHIACDDDYSMLIQGGNFP